MFNKQDLCLGEMLNNIAHQWDNLLWFYIYDYPKPNKMRLNKFSLDF